MFKKAHQKGKNFKSLKSLSTQDMALLLGGGDDGLDLPPDDKP